MGAYESLKSKGFETISNKELRFEIINLYEQWYSILQSNVNTLRADIQYIKHDFDQDYFDKFNIFNPNPEDSSDDIKKDYYSGEMIPNDFHKLKQDNRFNYHIKSLQLSHENINFHSMIHKERIDTLIIHLKLEIKRVEN